MIEALLLDLDGVLLDSSKIHSESYLESFSTFGIDIEFTYSKYAGRSTLDVMTEIVHQASLNSDALLKLTLLKQKIAERKFSEVLEIPLFPRVEISLLSLAERFRLALCTSASKATVNAFFRSGVSRQIFECIITADDLIKSKPDPEIYQKAMVALGLSPQYCAVVEDSISGIIAGLRSGAKVYHIGSKDLLKEINTDGAQEVMSIESFERFAEIVGVNA